MDRSSPLGSSVHGDSPGKNTGVGCHALLQRILPTMDRTQVSCTAGRFFTVWTTRLPCRMEASFKLSPLWGHTPGRNKALRDNWSWYVNPALRGEPWDSLSLGLQWVIPWMTQVPQGIHLCTYLAVSWNFFHKILRIHMSLSTLRLTFYKDKMFGILQNTCWCLSLGQEFWITRITPASFKMLSSGGLPITHYYVCSAFFVEAMDEFIWTFLRVTLKKLLSLFSSNSKTVRWNPQEGVWKKENFKFSSLQLSFPYYERGNRRLTCSWVAENRAFEHRSAWFITPITLLSAPCYWPTEPLYPDGRASITLPKGATNTLAQKSIHMSHKY